MAGAQLMQIAKTTRLAIPLAGARPMNIIKDNMFKRITGWRTACALFPLSILLVLLFFLSFGLGRDPTVVPSPLLGQKMPAFSQTQLGQAERQIHSADWLGTPALVNVWASWCAACRDEHPLLMAWAAKKPYPLYGINYKDKAAEALAWLDRFGNPYHSSIHDESGQVGLDWGVYGVPETFVIDAQGIIRYKHIGPLNRQVLEESIQTILEQLPQRHNGA